MPKEFDESKAIPAADIVKEPEAIPGLLEQYVLLRDTSLMGNYTNTIQAINLLADYGWEFMQFTNDTGGTMYTLMRNTQYKRKNE
jgi:hypothetical protein